MTIDLMDVVVQGDDQVCAQVNGEVVMMSIAEGCYFGLDEIGARIWQLLESPQVVSGLCAILVGEYEVAEAQCREDVCRFLDTLAEQGLIRVMTKSS